MAVICGVCELTVEISKLKEQLRKAQEELEIEKAIVKAQTKNIIQLEANKAEAVRIAVDVIDSRCSECDYAHLVTKCRICSITNHKSALESLTGQKFEELSK